MKPDFEAMTKAELRAYVLEHREDEEALRSLMSRRNPNAVQYNFPDTPEGRKQRENILRQKIEGKL
jgi:hypothetical protein